MDEKTGQTAQGRAVAKRVVMAVFDIATDRPDRDASAMEAFAELEFAIGAQDPELARWLRRGLVALLHCGVRLVAPPPPAVSQEQAVEDFADTLPSPEAEVTRLARLAPLSTSLWMALGARRKAGPVDNPVLLAAAIALVRRLHVDSPSPGQWWSVASALAEAAEEGATVMTPPPPPPG